MSAAPDTSMSCRELVELVTEYLEEALSPSQRARFDAHVSACPGCARYLQQMRDTLQVAGRLSAESLSEGAREELLHAFRGWKRR